VKGRSLLQGTSRGLVLTPESSRRRERPRLTRSLDASRLARQGPPAPVTPLANSAPAESDVASSASSPGAGTNEEWGKGVAVRARNEAPNGGFVVSPSGTLAWGRGRFVLKVRPDVTLGGSDASQAASRGNLFSRVVRGSSLRAKVDLDERSVLTPRWDFGGPKLALSASTEVGQRMEAKGKYQYDFSRDSPNQESMEWSLAVGISQNFLVRPCVEVWTKRVRFCAKYYVSDDVKCAIEIGRRGTRLSFNAFYADH